MILFDTTKAARATHRSGLIRVSARLLHELGAAARPVAWSTVGSTASADDWFVTAELFSEVERPGFMRFLDERRCRAAAIFHDAIPLRHPHITWPQSVARHPAYLKLLARFDRVWAVSQTSKTDLERYWAWLGLERVPVVDVLALGADFDATPRVTSRAVPPGSPRVLAIGILEPRKNQALLLKACERLWAEGVAFELHLAGRANPHFGGPIADRVRALARAGRAVHWHRQADDAQLARLLASARVTAFPTIAEGCGLPLLESLWHGVPCLCSDLPVLRENADGGGCVPIPVNDIDAWAAALRRALTDEGYVAELIAAATIRPLLTWGQAGAALCRATGG